VRGLLERDGRRERQKLPGRREPPRGFSRARAALRSPSSVTSSETLASPTPATVTDAFLSR
jgi:hypothetical protein